MILSELHKHSIFAESHMRTMSFLNIRKMEKS